MVKLPSKKDVGKTYAGKLGTAVGWGLESDSSNIISSVLRYVQSNVITNLLCDISYLGLIGDTQVCVDGSDGKSTCGGDSGGPLLVNGVQVCLYITLISTQS